MKKIIIFFILISIFPKGVFAQNINSYKYVIVPDKFEFLKEPNEYKLNELTRFLFNKYGFEAYLKGDELPENFDSNRCKALFANVTEDSGLFVTRLKVVLKDCKDNVVYISEEGTSREKDFKKAYFESLREAFQSIKNLDYKYDKNIVVAASSDPEPEKKEEATKKTLPQKPQTAEVKAEKPKENKAEAAQPVQKSEAITSNMDAMVFTHDTSTFYLKKDGDNFKFFQKGMEDPFAALIASQRENQFIYSSFSGQGIAYFDKGGNLIVEIPDKDSSSAKVKTYTLQK